MLIRPYKGQRGRDVTTKKLSLALYAGPLVINMLLIITAPGYGFIKSPCVFLSINT